MSDFINFIIGSCVFFGFVYCLFFVARAGWAREYDRTRFLNIHKIENATFEKCNIKENS